MKALGWWGMTRRPTNPFFAPFEIVSVNNYTVKPEFLHPKIYGENVVGSYCKPFYIAETHLPTTAGLPTTTELTTSTTKQPTTIPLPAWHCQGYKNVHFSWVFSNYLVVIKTEGDFNFDMEVSINQKASGTNGKWSWFIVRFIPETFYKSLLHFYHNNEATLFIHKSFNLTTNAHRPSQAYFTKLGFDEKWTELQKSDIIFSNGTENPNLKTIDWSYKEFNSEINYISNLTKKVDFIIANKISRECKITTHAEKETVTDTYIDIQEKNDATMFCTK